MRKSLFIRLMGGFVVVFAVAMAVVYVIANLTTASEFRYFMFRGQMVRMQNLADGLANYYRQRGSWQGVERLLASGPNAPFGSSCQSQIEKSSPRQIPSLGATG
jgi:hypothetical protein